MVAYFLVLTMIWHDASTNDYGIRRIHIEAPSGQVCEGALQEISAKWRKEKPSATILADCLPVVITERV